jgi:hypothetical protein
MAEMTFSAGIPIAGYLLAIEKFPQLFRIWIMLTSTGLIGWHILVVNDVCFPGNNVSKSKLGAALIFPLVSLSLSLGLGYPEASLYLVLMVVNWNLYSFYFKGKFMAALFNNFCGGYLHLSVGMLFANAEFGATILYGSYFALMMTGASMHHDALDVDEDVRGGFETGAVRFGARLWWRLGIVPIFLATLILFLKSSLFSTIFVSAFLVYLLMYGRFTSKPMGAEQLLLFRFLSRVTYGVAGIVFIILRVNGIA